MPGIDDGAADLEQAVAMCRAAAADGIEAIAVTPHLRHPQWPDSDREAIVRGVDRVRAAVGEHPRLYPGAEVHVGWGLLEAVDQLPAGPLLTLAGSRYLLLEFPFGGVMLDPQVVVHEVAVAGWVPVLAHPERIEAWIDDPEALAELVELGAVLAITAPGVLGTYGPGPRRCCNFLLDSGLAHLLSSDAHDLAQRPLGLSQAYAAVAARVGEAVAKRLTVENPLAVIENRPLASGVEGVDDSGAE